METSGQIAAQIFSDLDRRLRAGEKDFAGDGGSQDVERDGDSQFLGEDRSSQDSINLEWLEAEGHDSRLSAQEF